MHLMKLSEDQLKNSAESITLQRGENYVGKFFDCRLESSNLTGKIRGNHGVYEVSLKIDDDPLSYSCQCERSKSMFCKHAAGLGLTYIYTPWVFATDETIERDDVGSFDELEFYVKRSALKDLLEELRGRSIGVAQLAELTGVSVQQISGVVKDEQQGKIHALTDPLKLSCMYLLDRNLAR